MPPRDGRRTAAGASLSAKARLLAWSCLPLAALTCPTASAWAQQAEAGAGAVPSPADVAGTTAANSAPEPETGLADIVVTAQRRTEPLQRAAIAASAVTGDALIANSITQPSQLADVVPAIKVIPTGGTGNNIYLRGVGTTAVNSFAESAIGVNFNGVYIGRPSGLTGLLYDLDRVEVLKGPQGTLYGRNATGGVLNVISKKAALSDFSGFASLEYGNYDTKKAQAAINVPLGDTVAVRIAGQYINRDGYFKNGYDDEKGYGVRANVLWEPSPTFHVDLTADYQHQGGMGGGAVLVPASAADTVTPPVKARVEGAEPGSIAALTSRYAFLVNNGVILPPQDDGYIDSETYGVSATITGDTGFGTLTFIPAYRVIKPDFLSYRTGFYALNAEEARQTSGELRFASPEENRFQYIAGLYYYYQTQNFINSYIQGRTIGTYIQGDTDTESYAAFGQLRYSITNTLRLVGGLRYTKDTKSRNGAVLNPYPITAATVTTPVLNKNSYDNVSYRAGVEFDAAPRSLVYANVATGFKSGGYYTGVGNATYRPEKLMAYTLGSKNRFLNNRLQVNLEGFYWKYHDQQISYLGPVQTAPGVYQLAGLVSNIGQARMYGIDTEFRFLLTRADNFSANVQYLNAKYTSFDYLSISPNGAPLALACTNTPSTALPVRAPAKIFAVNCDGKPALNSPKWSTVFSYNHTFQLGGGFTLVGEASTRIESSRFLSIEYLPGERQGGFHKTNAILTLYSPDKKWSLAGFVENIENKTTINQASVRPITDAIYVGLDAPRTFGVRARVGF